MKRIKLVEERMNNPLLERWVEELLIKLILQKSQIPHDIQAEIWYKLLQKGGTINEKE
ncbi:MAG: hypothetical protein ACRCWQ_00545 [Bacilli bacterium]